MPFYSELRKHLSNGRFDGYRVLPGETDDELLSRHLWNLELCRSLYPLLHTLELTLRNRTNEALAAGTGHQAWLRPGAQTIFLFHPIQANMVQKAVAELSRAHPAGFTDGHLVAALTFGFWTALFGPQYHVPMRPYFRLIFPGLPATRSQKLISKRLHFIKLIRNRVFHHEPVWDRTTLPQLYIEIVEMTNWMCPEVALSMHLFDNFPCTYAKGAQHYVDKIRSFRTFNAL